MARRHVGTTLQGHFARPFCFAFTTNEPRQRTAGSGPRIAAREQLIARRGRLSISHSRVRPMKSMQRAFGVLLIAVVSVLLGAVEARAQVTTTAGLTVVNAGPSGEIASLAEANEVRVIFSEPMVTLGRIPTVVRAPFFRISPAVNGTFRWSGTTILIFTPDPKQPLPFATRYEVTIETTAIAVSGRRLAKPFTFDFTTPTVKLLNTQWYRRGGRADSPAVIALRFNQPIRQADVIVPSDGDSSSRTSGIHPRRRSAPMSSARSIRWPSHVSTRRSPRPGRLRLRNRRSRFASRMTGTGSGYPQDRIWSSSRPRRRCRQRAGFKWCSTTRLPSPAGQATPPSSADLHGEGRAGLLHRWVRLHDPVRSRSVESDQHADVGEGNGLCESGPRRRRDDPVVTASGGARGCAQEARA